MPPLKEINKSAFYNLKSSAKLATLLYIPLKEIKQIIKEKKEAPKTHYKIFTIKKRIEETDPKTKVKSVKVKQRNVEEPREKLKKIQSRIKNLLAAVETPDYLISGKQGKSIVHNGKAHLGNPYVICADIQSFYSNVSRDAVLQMFLHIFKTSRDVAYLLTELVMFNDIKTARVFVPTGSPSSQVIAYWAYAKTFNDIDIYAKTKQATFTLYVDDLTFSSKTKMSKDFLTNIVSRVKAVGLDINRKKDKIKKYGPRSHKIITGNCITADNKLMPKNKLMYSIKQIMGPTRKIEELSLSECQVLLGKIIAATQQNHDLYKSILPRVKTTLKARYKEEAAKMP